MILSASRPAPGRGEPRVLHSLLGALPACFPASFPAWAHALCCRGHVGGIRLHVSSWPLRAQHSALLPCPTLSTAAGGQVSQVLLQRAQCTGKGDELPAPGCAHWPPGHPRWLQDTPSPVPFPWQMKWGCLVLCASLVHQDGVARSSESKVKKPPLVMGG